MGRLTCVGYANSNIVEARNFNPVTGE